MEKRCGAEGTGAGSQSESHPITNPTMALSTTFDVLVLKPIPTRSSIACRCSTAMSTSGGKTSEKQFAIHGGVDAVIEEAQRIAPVNRRN